jgi:deoxyribodipyrimidine photo-lyase
MKYQKSLCWVRRDLRLTDHAALRLATYECEQVQLIFIFDTNILSQLTYKKDRRLTFIIEGLRDLETQLAKQGSSLIILHGDPKQIVPAYALENGYQAVYTARDYEPYAKERDQYIAKKIPLHTVKDSVIFEASEVEKSDGVPYKVFTPYKKRWLDRLWAQGAELPNERPHLDRLLKGKSGESILSDLWWEKIGFFPTDNIIRGGETEAYRQLTHFVQKNLEHYHEQRDFPALDGTSGLSPYLRFGMISIRDCARAALKLKGKGAETWLSELIWREFYMTILDRFPQVATESFRTEYDRIRWLGGARELQAWKDGKTGFAIVDAAMRCLSETGLMPNRLRMVTASFLCKTLLVDWREGERHFAQYLLDFDLAANNGGWQWCAGTGTDAQPYFRIFNPYSQAQKFDPLGDFVAQWCPEGDALSPIVDYSASRSKALLMYKECKS